MLRKHLCWELISICTPFFVVFCLSQFAVAEQNQRLALCIGAWKRQAIATHTHYTNSLDDNVARRECTDQMRILHVTGNNAVTRSEWTRAWTTAEHNINTTQHKAPSIYRSINAIVNWGWLVAQRISIWLDEIDTCAASNQLRHQQCMHTIFMRRTWTSGLASRAWVSFFLLLSQFDLAFITHSSPSILFVSILRH